MSRELPTGTVTFLFTDIEGSTRLLQDLGDRYRPVQDAHTSILRRAIADGDGVEIRTEGDSFFAVFRSPANAVAAAVAAQRGLAVHAWPHGPPLRVRMGMHTGEGVLGGDDYLGIDVNLAARIAAAAGGGQIVLSEATRTLVERTLPQGARLRPLGSHRLKDIDHAHRLHDVVIDGLPSDFPPLKSAEIPTNLPPERTMFVGREREVAAVIELLRGSRLVTLTGPGGSGKTRLALQAAGRVLDDYPDGVFLVDLAPIADSRLVPSSIGAALGVRAEGRGTVEDTLHAHVRHRELLLVLDNFEQVVEAAGVVAGVLSAAAGLRVLATSREPLHLTGEQEVPVPPLGLPGRGGGIDELSRSEAVLLFVQRAAAVDPAFRLTEDNAEVVAELCGRLDGLPLAIELAASRSKLLSPRAMLQRLERRLELLTGGPVDRPARQRTLREAIAWSFDLLEDPEATVFLDLSVFAGGWTLEAAEAVAEPEPDTDVLDALGSLIDKSLIRRVPGPSDEARFGMLETIRAYGVERLEAEGRADPARTRHAAFFLQVAEEAEPHLRGIDQKQWLDRLEAEHDNVRASLRWAIDSGHEGVALRLVAALWRFWHLRGHLAEGRRWAEEALALPAAPARTPERRRALTALGGLAYWQEDVPAFRRAYEEALEIAGELGDRLAQAEGTYNLGYAPAYEGDFPGAAAMWEDALGMFRDLGVRRGIADCLWILGIAARIEGDLPRSRALAEESLRLYRQQEDRFGITDALHTLGRVALAQGDLTTAGATFLEALDNDEDARNRTGMAIVLDNLAAKASHEGRHLRALRLAGASQAIKEIAGGQAPPPLIDLPDPREAARAVVGEAAVAAAWEEGRAMTLEQALALARGEGEG